ncbi:excisionase family DNA-binding protein [Emcibacter nanhaiensis]|uniref:Helix-turn-helix domain-containing protein n=1 Tax=Emcibacter nanhaiensis TaxID=1505037 RepID=A0A501PN89_9PROT|nr:helix-turn-helix domain-containing protein [Emcibacter nanhaiensis]TPD61909.1 helix-turn-helix domain-containing protein [Emcibacter nanhaiensis]
MSNAVINLPDEKEKEVAAENSRLLARFLDREEGISIQVEDDGLQTVTLPRQAVRLLVDIMTHMAQGDAVNIVPVHKEMTTQEAADFLNVSRPFLIKLLEEGKIPFGKVGTHRRILFGHLVEYKNERDAEMKRAASELTKLSQELELDM